MKYLLKTGQQQRIHDHSSDQTCHWVNVFKPLAFIVFRDAQLFQCLVRSPYLAGKELDAFDPSTYTRWLCKPGENGILNLLNAFLVVHELRGPPSSGRTIELAS
jgi:hypothetical protein